MFNCAVCEEAIGPNVKPIRIVTDTRAASYHNTFYTEDDYGNKQRHDVDSIGHEIVTEIAVCPDDAEKFGIAKPVLKGGPKAAYKFEEKQAEPFAPLFGATVVHNALERTNHDSKRAKRDLQLVIPMIKAFVDANPGVI
jgi:hypothetical protein